MIKRYWIIIYPDLKYGPKNFGVTASSTAQAIVLLLEPLTRNSMELISDSTFDGAEIIEGIDVRLLDQEHVVSNIGVVSRLGVWFPNFNS